jgi:hypothetical protein
MFLSSEIAEARETENKIKKVKPIEINLID